MDAMFEQTKITLFDQFERTDISPYVSSYDWLNKSKLPEAVAIRRTLECWFADYPNRGREEEKRRKKENLRRRFNSGAENDFCSAFFELYFHELLRGLGCGVDVEIPASGVRTSTDFLVKAPCCETFYLEATAIISPKELARNKEWQAILDRVEGGGSRDGVVQPWFVGAGAPVCVPVRGDDGPITRKLKKKSLSRYGNLGQPYIVAVDMITGIKDTDVKRALDRRFSEKQKHEGTSGIIVGAGISPWCYNNLRLYYNPFAKYLCPSFLGILPHCVRDKGQWIRKDGELPSKFLRILA
jgi:hypothetical protein